MAIDTAIFIYQLKDDATRRPIVDSFFVDLVDGAVLGVASVVAMLEVLVFPLKLGLHAVAAEYQRTMLSFPNLTLLDVTAPIAHQAAEIRARLNIALPDSIHLATAVEAGAAAFLTNDRRLMRAAPLIRVLIVDDLLDPR